MTAPFSASEYALLSAQSYFYYRDDGQQALTTEQFPGLSGWVTDLSRSYTNPDTGFSATVSSKGGQYVIAFRGTDDWRTGQGDDEHNQTFAPGWVRELTGAPSLGEQTFDAIEMVQRMVASGIPLESISFTGHSLGGGLAGIVAAYFNRPAVLFDPAVYNYQLDALARYASDRSLFNEPDPFDGFPRFDEWMGRTWSQEEIRQKFSQNLFNQVDIYRVQGESLDLLSPDFSDYEVNAARYFRLDLGNSTNQDSPTLSAAWTLISYLATDGETGIGPDNSEARHLHHISAMVLATLGHEGRSGVADVYNALRNQPDLLRRMIDKTLTAIKSYEQDSEENPRQDPSHGNFERVLILNRSFARDFGGSFAKTDNSAQGVGVQGTIQAAAGGADNVSKSFLSFGLLDPVIDISFILARKVADRLNRDDPANVDQASYDPANTLLNSLVGSSSLLGPDEHSIAIQFRALTTADESVHDLRDEQKAKLDLSLTIIRNTLEGHFGTSLYPKLFELYDRALVPGADATMVFGSIANGNSHVELRTGFGIFLGGDLRDEFLGSRTQAKDDFFYGGKGNDLLQGFGGNDYLEGGDGNDWIDGGEGNDELYGSDGADRLAPGKGTDVVYGGFGNDLLKFRGQYT